MSSPDYKVVNVDYVGEWLQEGWTLYGQPFMRKEIAVQAIVFNYSFKNPVNGG